LHSAFIPAIFTLEAIQPLGVLMKKIFVICPVRSVSEQVRKTLHDYVLALERGGALVHWPFRDTNQNDPIGLNICKENRGAIRHADEIHIWFDATSQGSLFDIGMTFAFLANSEKKIVLINREEVIPTAGKSFPNVLLELTKAPS
jgi:hypothetical protein